jgi:hypothetical protein
LSSKQTQQAFIRHNNKHKIGTLENPWAGPWKIHSPSGQVFAFGCKSNELLGGPDDLEWLWDPERWGTDFRGNKARISHLTVHPYKEGSMPRGLGTFLLAKLPWFSLWKWLQGENNADSYLFKWPILQIHSVGILSCEPPCLGQCLPRAPGGDTHWNEEVNCP